MAKKTKRKVSTGNVPVGEPEVMEVTSVDNTPTPSPLRATMTSRRVMSSTEFNPDYTYVISDLKRIGLLASIFFVILIALSFIL